jgi:hypothetical protein
LHRHTLLELARHQSTPGGCIPIHLPHPGESQVAAGVIPYTPEAQLAGMVGTSLADIIDTARADLRVIQAELAQAVAETPPSLFPQDPPADVTIRTRPDLPQTPPPDSGMGIAATRMSIARQLDRVFGTTRTHEGGYR